MENYLYRFRTSERLLGKERTECNDYQPGELEKLEIYFAPPDQLNDPLEGYKEIYWSGDRIVWANLFRHYILTLALRTWQVQDSLYGKSLTLDLPIGYSPADLHGTQLAAFNEMNLRFQGNQIFQAYIDALAKSNKKHYRPQLLYYFISLHTRFLGLVLPVNAMFGLGISLDGKEQDVSIDDTDFHNKNIASIEHYDGKSRDLESYRQIALATSSFSISTASVMPNEHHGIHEIITAFPSQYFEQIADLMHPRWYVACFMKECNNSAIWGSYGDNHKGICLKYRVLADDDTLSLEINKPVGLGRNGIIKKNQRMQFKKVHYDRNHSEIGFFQSLGNIRQETLENFWFNDGSGNMSNASEWFMTSAESLKEKYFESIEFSLTSKLPQWESEQEFRLVMSSHINLTNKKDRMLNYNFTDLEGLIFGIKTPLQKKIQAIRIVKKHCEREGIERFNFYQAYYDPQTKSIENGLLPFSIMDLAESTDIP